MGSEMCIRDRSISNIVIAIKGGNFGSADVLFYQVRGESRNIYIYNTVDWCSRIYHRYEMVGCL